MNNTKRSTRDREDWRLYLLFDVLYGLVQGSIVGAIFGAMFLSGVWAIVLPYITGAGAEPSRWGGALLGAIVGWCVAFGHARLQHRRTRRLRQVAESDNLRFSRQLIARLSDRVEGMFPAVHMIDFDNVVHKEIDSGRLVVADMTGISEFGSRTSTADHSSSLRRTLAYVEYHDVHFPSFLLQRPKTMNTIAASLAGVESIRFPDYPDFERMYTVTSGQAEQTRQLFNNRLVAFLYRRPGWEVRGDRNFLILSRPGHRCEPEAVPDFVQDVTQCAERFHEAARDLPNWPNELPIDNATSGGIDAANEAPETVAHLVVSDQLRAFLDERPPRRVPRNIRRACFGTGNMAAFLIGGFSIIAGGVFSLMSGYVVDGLVDHKALFAEVVGVSAFIVGLVIISLAYYYRLWNMRILRNGIVTSCRVERVRRTTTRVNEQRRFRMTVCFEHEGKPVTAHCNTYGAIVDVAQRCARENISVRVLVDPRRPQRVLWAEALDPAPRQVP